MSIIEKGWSRTITSDIMNRPLQFRNKTNILAKPALTMNEDSNSEFQLILSDLQRFDSKIESNRLETKNDFKLPDSKLNTLRAEMKDELKQVHSVIHSMQTEMKDEFKQADLRFDSFRAEMKDELKQVHEGNISLRAEMKAELKQVHSSIHSMAADLINELRQFATKADLSEMERRNELRYATKDNLAQTKFGLVKMDVYLLGIPGNHVFRSLFKKIIIRATRKSGQSPF